MLLDGLEREAPMTGRKSRIPKGAKLSGLGAFCEMHLVSLLALSFSLSFWKVSRSISDGISPCISSFWINLTMSSLNFFMDSVYFTSWLFELVLLVWFLRLTFMRKFVRLCSSNLSSSYCEWVFDSRSSYLMTSCSRFISLPRVRSMLLSIGMFCSVWYYSAYFYYFFNFAWVYNNFWVLLSDSPFDFSLFFFDSSFPSFFFSSFSNFFLV